MTQLLINEEDPLYKIYLEELAKFPKRLQELLENKINFVLENTYIKKLEFKDNMIAYYEERYDQHNGYYLWTKEKCRILKRIIKEKTQCICVAQNNDGTYYFERVDDLVYGPLIRFLKPLSLSGLVHIHALTCDDKCHCAQSFRTKFPYRGYVEKWFLFDKQVSKEEFFVYLENQRKIIFNDLVLPKELINMIYEYLKIQNLPETLPDEYQENYSYVKLYEKYEKLFYPEIKNNS